MLDVGCGTGTMLGYLARYGAAEGVDMDEEAIEYCRARGLEKVTRADAENLPFPSSTFDLVTAFDIVEHTDDDLRVLSEFARVLKPGGTLLVSVPAYMFLWGAQDEISLHKRRYVASQLRARLESAGFQLQKLTYMNAILFGPIAAIRLVRRLLPKPPEVKSDFTFPAPRFANGFLAAAFGAERFAVRRFDIPFGVSIAAVARKPVTP